MASTVHAAPAPAPAPAPALPVLREIAQLPGPRAWPLLGNLPQMRPARMHRDLEAWSARYGPYFRMRIGRQSVLVVADHAAINGILRDRPDGFRRPTVMAAVSAEMGGHPGLFLVEGSAWRNQRRMVMQAFAPQAVKAYFPALVKVGLRLQRRWEQAARAQLPIDLTADLKRYTVDIIAGLAFGSDVNTLESDEDLIQRHIDVVLPAVARRSVTPWPYWRYFRLPADRRLERSVAALTDAVNLLIAKARARLRTDPPVGAPRNLLEAMLVAADQADSGVDDIAVSGNVSTMLLAGEDTTANTLAWMIYLMQCNPHTLRAAEEEVRRLAPDPAAFTIEQIDALDYLDACAQEAMRLKPVAPFIPLEAVRASVVGDVRVPRGSAVWCLLRRDSVDEAHVHNAAAFDPQRWLAQADPAIAIDKHLSLPFGGGPRMCPGRYLALWEIKVAMAVLLGRFDIAGVDTPDGKPARELFGFVMAPFGLRLRLRARA